MSTYQERLMETLLSYMEPRPLFTRRHITKLGLLGDETYTKMWLGLTKLLNNVGQYQSTEEWQDYWKSLKLENKQKMSKYLEHEASTGNLQNEIILTDNDIRISRIFGRFGTGLPIVPEIGVKPLENTNNPLDLFQNVVGKMNNKAKSKVNKLALPIQNMNVSAKQEKKLLHFMINNVLYSLKELDDVQERNRLNTELVVQLNALEDAQKDLFQWTAENMYRHCDEESPSSNEFVNLVANYMKFSKRNTNQKASCLNKLLLHVSALKNKNPQAIPQAISVKREMKKELDEDDDIFIVDLESETVDNSKGTSSKVYRNQDQSVTVQTDPSTSSNQRTASVSNKQLKKEDSLQIVGDTINLDVLKSVVQGEVNSIATDAVEKAVECILKNPQFIKRLKDLFQKDIESLAKKLYLKWQSDERENSNNDLGFISNRDALQDLSNRPLSVSARVRSPVKSCNNVELQNSPPQDEAYLYEDDEDHQQVIEHCENYEQEEVDYDTDSKNSPLKASTRTAKQVLQNAENYEFVKEDYGDNFEDSPPKAPTRKGKKSLPYEFDIESAPALQSVSNPIHPGSSSHQINLITLSADKNPPKMKPV